MCIQLIGGNRMKRFKTAVIFFVLLSMLLSILAMPVYATTPAIPTGMYATGIDSNEFTLNWSSVSNATSYEIYMKEGAGSETKIATLNEQGPLRQLDLVLIIDRSGSMEDYITKVKEQLNMFVETVKAASIDVRIGMVTFVDVMLSSCASSYPFHKTDLTSNLTSIQTAISNINVSGGCGHGESQLEAIAQAPHGALHFNFRSDAALQFILVTDEPVHDNADGDGGDGYSIYDIDEIVDQVQKRDIMFSVVGPNATHYTTGYYAKAYSQLKKFTDATNGQYIDMTLSSYQIQLRKLADIIIAARSHELTGLKEYTQYTLRLKACNGTTCSNFSSPINVTTKDVTAPTKPANLSTSNKTSSGFTLNWAAASDTGSGVNEYIVYRNGTVVATIPATVAATYSHSSTGLSSSATYSMHVVAKDHSGNVSAQSDLLTVNLSDNISPTVPSGLQSSNVTRNSVRLTWNASTDNIGVTGYNLYQGIVQIASVSGTTTTYNVSGLTENTSYTFTVRAKDAAGNLSNASNSIVVTTQAPANRAPTAITINNNTVDENYWLGYTVGTLTTTDPDAGNTFTYSLVTGEGDANNASFMIDGDKLKVAADLDFIDDYVYSIRVQSTDNGGLSYAQPLEIEVTQSNVSLNNTYNQLTVFFQENIVNNKADLTTLKNTITYTGNAEVASPTYSALSAGSSVKISKNTLIITFAPALPNTSANYRVKIAADAFKDASGNKSTELTTSPFYINGAGPVITNVTVSKNKKIVTLTFNKTPSIATAGANAAAKLVSFKNAVTLQRSGAATYSALDAKDKVAISGRTMIVTLSTALAASNNNLKIAANSLQDVGSNKTGELNPKVDLDTTGPTINKVTVSGKNKIISITFKDGAFNAFSGANKAALLKAAVTLSPDGGANFTALGASDNVELVSGNPNGLMLITLNSAITGSQNRIRIATDALRDSFKNLNTMLETSSFAADEVGPVNVAAPQKVFILANSSNKTIAVNFNERVYNGSTALTPALKTTALRNAVTYTLDADAATPTYVALTAADKVSTKGKQLRIILSKPLPPGTTPKNFKVKIAAGVVADFAGNTTLAIESDKFTIDKTGPKLR
jgi:chitodextrinase